jgi:hypothetical protein
MVGGFAKLGLYLYTPTNPQIIEGVEIPLYSLEVASV